MNAENEPATSLAEVLLSEPDVLTGRRLQLWDYSPSHQTLLMRCAANTSDLRNIDLTFVGVSHMSTSSFFVVDSVYIEQMQVESQGFVFRLRSGSENHSIVAAQCFFERNYKALSESLTDSGSVGRSQAENLERTVRETLRSHEGIVLSEESQSPDDRLAHSSRGPDFFVAASTAEPPLRQILVEVIWSNESSVERQTRRLMMDRLPKWGIDESFRGELVFVVGGLQSAMLAEAIKKFAVTASGIPAVSTVDWSDAGAADHLLRVIDRGVRA